MARDPEILQGLRVLVVEDEKLIAMELGDRLSRMGMTVVASVDTGDLAVTSAIDLRPDLVLMDIRLKGNKDGVQAAGDIAQAVDVPIVYLTAHSDRATLDRAKGTAPYGYVMKPFQERELFVAIEMAVHRHALERQLRESERKYVATLASIGDAVVATDLQGRVSYMNPVAEALTGWSFAEARGLPSDTVVQVARDAAGAVPLSPVGQAVQENRIIRFDDAELFLISKSNEVIPIDACAAPIVDEQARMTGAVVAFRDIRDRRLAAERASHAKDEFLAMLAHELRTPLGAIHSAVGVLESVDSTSSNAVRALVVIARQVRHLSRLTDDLLDVERLLSGKIRLDRHPLDMAEAVRHVVAAFTGDAALDRRIDVCAEPVGVDGDAVRLEQVFANIVTNAVKYTPPGGVIRVSVRSDADDAVFAVEDTGCGIPPELLPSIFDMFVQGETTLDRAHGGLGIGLTLVRRLIDLHGGSVTASSGGVGNGSTFTVRLPRVAYATIPPALASALPGTMPKRVLLIEDSRDLREMFRLVLEQAGHTVYEADNGYSGLALIDRERPDVAIIDIGLPGLDGYQVARRIRAHPSGPAMVLVAMTGYGALRDREHSVEAGFDHHLVKPVDLEELWRLIDDCVACTGTQG